MIEFRKMVIEDYEESFALWNRTEGMGLSSADSRESIQLYLERNQGFSQVAVNNGRIIGTLLSGHDGRRGYLYHLAVEPGFRGQSIAKNLVRHAIALLREAGIQRAHIMVLDSNEAGKAFWSRMGWTGRDDVLLRSSDTDVE
ncbi:GNAT family N-acetyltransferase [Paenibacillus shunpengii]|uniref:GNAT family N-acetyltransferase n=1 Tax=Paenibacillus shunpengii TaxID=2054424 RepID=A0ABW5SM17_9BACL|nr:MULTISPECIES: GNAT family N-acetyltransferase [unclassified Paenibacillus]OMC71649.1 GNAT family N-acetyltransferase [Paenibacillus sp. FSL H7-0326]SDW33525.1 Ribosomal protein S18 acetylase RimI [Paenibacillus sp. PDC88]